MVQKRLLVYPFLIAPLLTSAANATPPNRVLAQIDDSQRVYLKGNVHPKALPAYDQGPVSPTLELQHVTLNLKASAAQQADLNQLLADQQNPSSASYHRWLTPEEYGARFGVSDRDIAKTIAWLQGQGLTVTSTARAKNFITFDGSAANLQTAFRIEIHHYLVDGELHFANSTEPAIPAALEPIVHSIRGLHDFRMHPRVRSHAVLPDYTSASSGNHYVAPNDFATIYDVNPLYSGGFDGTGQKLVIVGQTAINLSDLQTFRSMYNLPGQDPQLVPVPNTRTPGVSKGDLGEADLDLEWSSAVARNATIIYVYAPNVDQSWQYAIDQSLAPVISSSYGLCEPDGGSAYASSLRSLAQQANSEGMTWFAASGDDGGADCSSQTATDGTLSVDLPAAIPEVTGVGGTEFSEATGTYWNATNDANKASVLSYIPEITWNDSATDGSPSASGGGASIYFSKPAWQTGAGVPSDGARDVPDVALNASADHDGYLVYSSGSLQVFGGTSAPTPIFAAIAALLNQYLVQKGAQLTPGLGNINPKLYSLAQSTPTAFHDITSGNNIVTVSCGRRGCTTPPTPVGYNAGPNYDQVTGLGSVDVFNLISAWSGTASSRLTPNVTASATATSLLSGGATVLTATVVGANGVTPTGSVVFQLGAISLGSAQLSGSAGTATATLSVVASQLVAGTNNITVQYISDNSTFSNAAATVTITVGSAGLSIAGVADGASFQHNYAPGEVLSIFGSELAPSTQTASSVPLPITMAGVSVTIGGVAAPLYLVSSSQLNVQIPYESAVGTNVTLVVTNNGQIASYSLTLNATAPAIFAVPVSAKSGTVATLYMTGAGAVSPSIATGSAPASGTPVASLPKPVNQPVSVTVGGISAPIQFAGIPTGLVGVLQINYQVPAGLTPGVQPVVVTIGGASSAEGSITVTQ